MATISNSRLVPVASTGREAMQLLTRPRAFLTRDCETRRSVSLPSRFYDFVRLRLGTFAALPDAAAAAAASSSKNSMDFRPRACAASRTVKSVTFCCPALHAADVGAIDAHPLRHGFLAEPCREPIAAHILTKHEADIHP